MGMVVLYIYIIHYTNYCYHYFISAARSRRNLIIPTHRPILNIAHSDAYLLQKCNSWFFCRLHHVATT